MDKWIFHYVKQYRSLFLLVVLLGALAISFGAALMFTSGYLISKAATQPETILMVYVPIVAVRAFGIGRAVLSYIERLTGHHFILKILSDMRTRLYKVVEQQAHFIRSRFLTGDLLGALADDIEHLQDFYLKTLFPAIASLAIYTMVIILAGLFSLPFAVGLAFLVGLLVFVSPLLSLAFMQVKNERLKEGKNQLYQKLTDAVFGISDWLFSGRSADFIQSFEKKQNELLELETKKQSFINWRDLINQVILGLTVIYAIYLSSGMAHGGEIPPTLIAAVGLMMLSLLESFLPLSDAISEVTTYQDSIARLENIEQNNQAIWMEKQQEDFSVPSDVSIQLNGVSFQFSSGTPLLHDFDLSVTQGEKIAILGPSGAGKSTLLKLIQGALKPSRGVVLVNGKQAHELDAAIPSIMAVLNQKPYLFHTSVMNNLRLGNLAATDEEVYEAAKKVGLHEMIKDLPEGYETNMLETGQRFSGGERQRIALARILLQNTPVVIMDEPTVGLDPITEKKLLATIFETLAGKTIIWVTHHLAGMEKMDKILFIDKGKITMSGSHQELLEQEERYRRLYLLDHPLKADPRSSG
jgi:ATP-binding cassette subfamily C protein CydC